MENANVMGATSVPSRPVDQPKPSSQWRPVIAVRHAGRPKGQPGVVLLTILLAFAKRSVKPY